MFFKEKKRGSTARNYKTYKLVQISQRPKIIALIRGWKKPKLSISRDVIKHTGGGCLHSTKATRFVQLPKEILFTSGGSVCAISV